VTTSIRHGGNQRELRERLGLGDEPLLDFSTGVNPLGTPAAVLAAARGAMDRLDRHPELGCPRLVERLAEFHQVPVDRVIVGAGTTELISLVGQSLREVLALHAEELGAPKMTVSHLVEPTYAEYRRTSVLNGLRTEVWAKHVLGWSQEFLPRSASGIFWTGHPNNPTGRAWERARLLSLVDDTQGLLVVVDETFLPFLADGPDRSLARDVCDRPNLLVLRSLTNLYAMPALRVGYALASSDMVTRLRQFQNPWSVTAAAEAAALAALAETEYVAKTVALVSAEAERITERLWELPGLRPVWPARERPAGSPPRPNYVLISLTDTPCSSTQLHEALARKGLLVRECSDFHGLEDGALLTGTDQLVATRGHLRIGLRMPADNERLLSTLAELLKLEAPR
jgi:threonine-phosphate decarboxylase